MTLHETSRSPLARRAVFALAAAALALTACGSGDDDAASDDSTTEDTSAENTEGDSDASEPQGIQQNSTITVEGAPLDPYDESVEDLSVGTAAPVVGGESFDGTAMTIGGPTENATMIVFLAHWCPHCNDEIPELIALEEAGELPEGLDVIGVSTAVDPSADNYPPSDWIDENGWPWPTMADDADLTAIAAMGGTSFPFTVVLDEDGNVLARKAGTSSAEETTAFLEDALAG